MAHGQKRISFLWLCLLALIVLHIRVSRIDASQPPQATEEEVFLSFRYQGGVSTIITALVDGEQFFLPVTELFSLLSIKTDVNLQDLSVSGFYIERTIPYSINFRTGIATVENREIRIPGEAFRVKAMDFYLKPAVFQDLFGLDFTVDIERLLLKLYTPDALPVVQKQQRQQERNRELLVQNSRVASYPLRFQRDPHLLNGGFLDYTLYSSATNSGNITSYNLNLGGELLYGDLQGNLNGGRTPRETYLTFTNLRWRLVPDENPYLSQLKVGQQIPNGLLNLPYTGLAVTNEPVIQQYMYDDYIVSGVTTPEAEVELYRDNRLVDYAVADGNGNYRFSVPLTYGTSRIHLKIYGPTGEVEEIHRRIQIPFTFLPRGKVYYNVNTGTVDDYSRPWNERAFRTHANVAMGVTRWFTGKVGTDYIQTSESRTPFFYSSLAARISSQYLVNLDLVPGTYYRVTGSVVYPSSASWRLAITQYQQKNILNRIGLLQDLSLNVYYPLRMFKLPVYTYMLLNAQRTAAGVYLNQRSQISTRIHRTRFRLEYRSAISESGFRDIRRSESLTATAIYMLPRKHLIPRFLHNTILTGDFTVRNGISTLESARFQVTRSVFRNGYVRLMLQRNFLLQDNIIELAFAFDLGKVRSTSTARTRGGESGVTQTFRGSVGYDSRTNSLQLHNRQQVGRAAATFRLFVDANNSGRYDPGERLLDPRAIRIYNAPLRPQVKKGVARFMQLEPYRRYNMVVNKAKIADPMLVPRFETFSVVTDPNTYKPIDIPFYLTGIIDGKIVRKQGPRESPVAGLRVHVRSVDGDYEQTLRTFADGSFYAMEIPPGTYEMTVDENQLKFLESVPEPHKQLFTILPKAEGDVVEGLNFALLEPGQIPTPQEPAPLLAEANDSDEKTVVQPEMASRQAAGDLPGDHPPDPASGEVAQGMGSGAENSAQPETADLASARETATDTTVGENVAFSGVRDEGEPPSADLADRAESVPESGRGMPAAPSETGLAVVESPAQPDIAGSVAPAADLPVQEVRPGALQNVTIPATPPVAESVTPERTVPGTPEIGPPAAPAADLPSATQVDSLTDFQFKSVPAAPGRVTSPSGAQLAAGGGETTDASQGADQTVPAADPAVSGAPNAMTDKNIKSMTPANARATPREPGEGTPPREPLLAAGEGSVSEQTGPAAPETAPSTETELASAPPERPAIAGSAAPEADLPEAGTTPGELESFNFATAHPPEEPATSDRKSPNIPQIAAEAAPAADLPGSVQPDSLSNGAFAQSPAPAPLAVTMVLAPEAPELATLATAEADLPAAEPVDSLPNLAFETIEAPDAWPARTEPGQQVTANERVLAAGERAESEPAEPAVSGAAPAETNLTVAPPRPVIAGSAAPEADLPAEGTAPDAFENLNFATAEPLPEPAQPEQPPPIAPSVAVPVAPVADLPAQSRLDSLPNVALQQSPLPEPAAALPSPAPEAPGIAGVAPPAAELPASETVDSLTNVTVASVQPPAGAEMATAPPERPAVASSEPPAADLPPEEAAPEEFENLNFATAEPLPEPAQPEKPPPITPSVAVPGAPVADLPAHPRLDSLPNVTFEQGSPPDLSAEAPMETAPPADTEIAAATPDRPMIAGRSAPEADLPVQETTSEELENLNFAAAAPVPEQPESPTAETVPSAETDLSSAPPERPAVASSEPPAADLPPEEAAPEEFGNFNFATAEPLPEPAQPEQPPPITPSVAVPGAPVADLPAHPRLDSLPNVAFEQGSPPDLSAEAPMETAPPADTEIAAATPDRPMIAGRSAPEADLPVPESTPDDLESLNFTAAEPLAKRSAPNREAADSPPVAAKKAGENNPSGSEPREIGKGETSPLPDDYASLASPDEPVPGEYPGGPGGVPDRAKSPGADARGTGWFVTYGLQFGILLLLLAGILGYLLSRRKRK